MNKTIVDDLNERLINGAIRILLRDENKFFSCLELQIELNKNKSDVFIKPPAEGRFVTKKNWSKVPISMSASKNIDVALLNNIHNDNYYVNPYLSWHGKSGRIHVNGFNLSGIKDPLISDSVSIKDSDLREIHLISTATLPITDNSLPECTPPPIDFKGNYFEFSNSPFIPNSLNNEGRLHLVVDKNELGDSTHIALDIFAHKKSSAKLEELPYTDNSFTPIDKPFTYSVNPEENETRITIFLYLPKQESGSKTHKYPISVIARADECEEVICYQASLVEHK